MPAAYVLHRASRWMPFLAFLLCSLSFSSLLLLLFGGFIGLAIVMNFCSHHISDPAACKPYAIRHHSTWFFLARGKLKMQRQVGLLCAS
ncbi:hypothetical protein BDW71DRAFT_144447 [Aspergillus fruticulosus]